MANAVMVRIPARSSLSATEEKNRPKFIFYQLTLITSAARIDKLRVDTYSLQAAQHTGHPFSVSFNESKPNMILYY